MQGYVHKKEFWLNVLKQPKISKKQIERFKKECEIVKARGYDLERYVELEN
jgi:hypothetical protein